MSKLLELQKMGGMMGKCLMLLAGLLLSVGCRNGSALGKASFEKKGQAHYEPKASIADVISMGRDDDDGNAQKWHTGGGED